MIRHNNIIQQLVTIYKPKSYLELGLYEGETFNLVKPLVDNAVGVDINPSISIDGEIHTCTTNNYFDTCKEMFDFIFIDAEHKYESVKTDFYNSVKHLNPRGLICLHDTDPENNSLFDFSRCGDAYRFVSDLEKNPSFNILTLPVAEAGLSIVTRVNETRTNLRNMNYD